MKRDGKITTGAMWAVMVLQIVYLLINMEEMFHYAGEWSLRGRKKGAGADVVCRFLRARRPEPYHKRFGVGWIHVFVPADCSWRDSVPRASFPHHQGFEREQPSFRVCRSGSGC